MSDSRQGRRRTVRVQHSGRRSGRPYTVKVWFVESDGEVKIGSLDDKRNWVRNLRAVDHTVLDFGDGPRGYNVSEVVDPAERDAFRAAIRVKYPLSSRVIMMLEPRNAQSACFSLTPQ